MQAECYFKWSDAWILTGMMCYVKEENEISTQVSLTDIIVVADWINHAILTHSELNEGILRLMEAGYVNKIDKEFSLTELVIPLYSKFAKSKRGIFEKVSQIEKYINSKSLDSNFILSDDSVPQAVSAEDYNQALEAYKGMWKRK